MNSPSKKLLPEVRAALAEVANNTLDHLWENAYEFGVWVRHEDIPEIDTDELVDSGVIENPERVEALCDGSKPTRAEIKQYREWWVESRLAGDGDADLIPGYALSKVQDAHKNEGTALVLRTGYSFSQITTWLEGVYSSGEEAVQWMKKGGWCT
jgi:hypothetical protein